jgi:hypothetical protein
MTTKISVKFINTNKPPVWVEKDTAVGEEDVRVGEDARRGR